MATALASPPPVTRVTSMTDPPGAVAGGVRRGRSPQMEWCDENDIDFVFGLPGNTVLDRLVDQTADTASGLCRQPAHP